MVETEQRRFAVLMEDTLERSQGVRLGQSSLDPRALDTRHSGCTPDAVMSARRRRLARALHVPRLREDRG